MVAALATVVAIAALIARPTFAVTNQRVVARNYGCSRTHRFSRGTLTRVNQKPGRRYGNVHVEQDGKTALTLIGVRSPRDVQQLLRE